MPSLCGGFWPWLLSNQEKKGSRDVPQDREPWRAYAIELHPLDQLRKDDELYPRLDSLVSLCVGAETVN
jgi:hypothetical protein